MGKWIWKFGEFEKYHNMLVHSRRNNYGYPEPPVWKIYPPVPAVRFTKSVHTEGGLVHIRSLGEISVSLFGDGPDDIDGEKKLWGAHDLNLPAGDYRIQIRIMNTRTFPAVCMDGAVETDETWLADDCTGNWTPVGTSELFGQNHPDAEPDVFPFVHFEVRPSSVTPVRDDVGEAGFLYDFGKEVFGRIHIRTVPEKTEDDNTAGETRITDSADFSNEAGDHGFSGKKASEKVRVILGESREEALSSTWGYTRFNDVPVNGALRYPAYAVRYLFVGGEKIRVAPEVFVETEMSDRKVRGSFSCSEDVINRVWKTAEYTFHLCSQEFYLDGIKRDRWVWSADAYQSYFVNHYLYLDQETEKRTITALGEGLPVEQYINTIMDYTFFWLISLLDYYVTYGDRHFLEQIYPVAREHMMFCYNRRSRDGFIRGQKNDWVFIDWAPMDKTGALCGEQILLAKAMECFGEVEALVMSEELASADTASGTVSGIHPERVNSGNTDVFLCVPKPTGIDWKREAEDLRREIVEKFYDSEKRVFIDSFESGKRNVTRQSNLLVYLYLGVSDAMKQDIYERVVCNPEIIPITTPYFKFYENQVLCEEGDTSRLEDNLRDYYGGMLDLGATTLFEQYDPSQKGAEHYAMYGRPFEKSLCHAWSCSPIYLLGRYRLGVKNTGIAYSTFTVEPNPGDLKEFEGTVPLPQGEVHVKLSGSKVHVLATAPGGTLIAKGKRIPLTAGEEVSAAI